MMNAAMMNGAMMNVATVLEPIAWLWFLGWGAALSWKDARSHRLPNAWVAVALVGALGLLGLVAWQLRQPLWLPLATAGVVSVSLLVIHIVGGMGMGDVKYGLVVGLYLGALAWEWSWWIVWWGLWWAFVLATAWALVRRRKQHGAAAIPFGPFLTMGVWVAAASVWAVQS